MAGRRITIQGVAEEKQAFDQIGDRVSIANLRAVLADAIDLVRQEAARRIQSGGHVKTGALLASLQTGVGKSSTIASAWTKAGTYHRHLLEYGHRAVTSLGKDTGKMVPAHPYFAPALAAVRDQVRQKVIDGVKMLVEGGNLGALSAFHQLVAQTKYRRQQKAAARKAKREAKAARIRRLLSSPHHRL